MIGVAEYMLIGWFSLCSLAVLFVFRTTRIKVKKVDPPNDFDLLNSDYVRGLKDGAKLNEAFREYIDEIETKKQSVNKNAVEIIDVRNEFATLQDCVKDLIYQSELAWKLVVNKLNHNPCFPLDEEMGAIKWAHRYLQEIADRAQKTIDEINAKREPSK